MNISINNPICLKEIGSRSNQEDALYPEIDHATKENKFFIVCDGMGGHEHGEVASQTICEAISNYISNHWDNDFFSDDLLLDALNAAIYQINKLDDDSIRKPGTTMTFLCFHRGGVIAAHIGDSRIYHIRPSEQRILYKSRDHSLVYDLFLAGEISKDEMATYDKKNVLTRAILTNMDREPKADVIHITDIRPDDYFMLCTDGMLERMNDEELVSILCKDVSNTEKYSELVLKTKDNADNHSAYIIQITDVETEEGDEQLINDEASNRSNAILLERDEDTVERPKKYGLLYKLVRWWIK